MLDILKFIFSDFWYFAGIVVLISVTFSGLAKVINALRGERFQ